MRSRPHWRPILLLSCLATCVALPALADVTVVARHTLVNGDTLTRPSYYSLSRCRVTGPDGKEFMYESKSKTVTVIDHQRKAYYTAPLAQADSIADQMLLESKKQMAQLAAQDQEAWMAKVAAFNDSIKVTKTMEERRIGAYTCTRWVLTAGSYLEHERWVARSLAVANFAPEVQKVVMASAMDPVGRVLLKLMLNMREIDGLPLAARTKFRTPTQSGSFSFETLHVISTSIPKSAWEIPKDYQAIKR